MRRQFDWENCCLEADKFVNSFALESICKELKIGAWETKKDFEKNEFSSQNNISGIDLEIFVTEESMSICEKKYRLFI